MDLFGIFAEEKRTKSALRALPIGLGSILCLAGLFFVFPLSTVLAAAQGISAPVLLAVVVLYLTCQALAALRWRVLVGSGPEGSGGLAVEKSYFAGFWDRFWYNKATRKRDIVRTMGVSDERFVEASRADDMTLILSRVGLLAMAVLLLADLTILIAAISAFAATAVGLFWRLQSHPMPGFRTTGLGAALLAAFCVEFSMALAAWQLSISAGASVDFAPWLLAWMVARFAARLPLSYNGLGMREVVLVVALAPWSPVAVAVFATGLVWHAVTLLAAGLGGLAWWSAKPSATVQP